MTEKPTIQPGIQREAQELNSEISQVRSGSGDRNHLGEELFKLRLPENKAEYDAVLLAIKQQDSSMSKYLETATIVEENGKHLIQFASSKEQGSITTRGEAGGVTFEKRTDKGVQIRVQDGETVYEITMAPVNDSGGWQSHVKEERQGQVVQSADGEVAHFRDGGSLSTRLKLPDGNEISVETKSNDGKPWNHGTIVGLKKEGVIIDSYDQVNPGIVVLRTVDDDEFVRQLEKAECENSTDSSVCPSLLRHRFDRI